ncbi:unnamed protein product [Rotaria sp. Silwood2]|nr:unnamed protein product [Rotaria sp. Silwood2]CAF3939075.1 unnamed protein product [Rotaria sp. Silwood2]
MFSPFMLQLLLLFLFLNYTILQHTNPSSLHWDYQREGPDTWQHTFNTCNGKAQSPINIRTSRVKYDPKLRPLSLNGFTTNTSLHIWNFTHNGHTIVVYPPASANLSISGANLPESFSLVQFHFHWGYNAYQGSEHTIDGIKYPLEIHFVHQAHFSRAQAVLGIFFELQHDDNPYINDLLSILNQTTNISISIEKQIDITPLFPTLLSPRFYRYNGSLTTPPCTEGITWIILASTVSISEYQLEVFAGNSISWNFRHPQKLYSRQVLANFQSAKHENLQDEEDESIHCSSVCVQQVLTLLLSYVLIIFMLK